MSDLTPRERGLIATELRWQADRFERYANLMLANPGSDTPEAGMSVAYHGIVIELRDRADELDGAS